MTNTAIADIEILCDKDRPKMRKSMKEMLKDGYIPKSITYVPKEEEICVLMVKPSK